ncbi:hypothetical protein LJC42_02410 [Eubacteriales bacterium OttesenSCG-928-K08]|nr:hypothetical protein [Eubacteriales bacterium OttesenSCG-928-K08]
MANKLEYKDIDFLPLLYKKEPTKKQRGKRTLLIAGVCVLLVMGAAVAFYFKTISDINAEMAQVDAQISSVKPSHDQALANLEIMEPTSAMANSIINLNKAMEGVAVVTTDDYEKIISLCGANLSFSNLNFSLNDQVLVIQLEGKNATDVSTFVTLLNSTGIFNDVIYSGYTQASSDNYRFEVNCMLKAPLVETEAEEEIVETEVPGVE